MKTRFSYTTNRAKESGINLDKYLDLSSVKEFKEYLKNKNYFSIRERNKKMYADNGTTKEPMTVQVKLKDLDIDDVTGYLSDIVELFNNLKKEYEEMCWGKIIIDNDKDFWQGNYEGEDWTLLHEYEELEEDFNERQRLITKIEKQIKSLEKRKKTNKDKKEYKKYLALKEKFEKENTNEN